MRLDLITKHFCPNTILDIGANIGQFHNIAKSFFPDSFIFSIEASSDCEPYLKSITDNYYIGLLSKDNSEYDFYSRKDTGIGTGNSMYRENTDFYSDEKVKVIKKTGIKLDDLMDKNKQFDLIKIDTQGSELDIIQGGIDLCKRAKGILLEVSITEYNKGSPLYDEVINFMNGIGFKVSDVLGEERNHGSNQQDILFLNQKYFAQQ